MVRPIKVSDISTEHAKKVLNKKLAEQFSGEDKPAKKKKKIIKKKSPDKLKVPSTTKKPKAVLKENITNKQIVIKTDPPRLPTAVIKSENQRQPPTPRPKNEGPSSFNTIKRTSKATKAEEKRELNLAKNRLNSAEYDSTSLPPSGEANYKNFVSKDFVQKASPRKKASLSPDKSASPTAVKHGKKKKVTASKRGVKGTLHLDTTQQKKESSLSMRNNYYSYDLINDTTPSSKPEKKVSKLKISKQKKLTKRKVKKKKSFANIMTQSSAESFKITPIREMKHNDSFVISARKLHSPIKIRGTPRPDSIKLQSKSSPIKPKMKKFKGIMKQVSK